MIIESALFFALGFVLSYCVAMFYLQKKNSSYLMTTIKEDIDNLQVTIANLFDIVKGKK